MPRQKNRGQQYFFPTYQAPTRTRRWKMASYIRLSKENLQKIKKGLDCSNSVKNQRDILNYFYETHAEEFESIREYVDDGHTGTDTDREHFQEMLSDIMSGKINCVVVKDLSRLADILGHSSVNTTRVYTMESGAVHARQMERMGLVLTT